MGEADKPRPRRGLPAGEDRWEAVGDDYSTIFRSDSDTAPAAPSHAAEVDDETTTIRPAIRDRDVDPRAAFEAEDAARARASAQRSEPGWRSVLASVGLTAASTVVPGSGMLGARSRAAKVVGGVVTLAFLGGLVWILTQVSGGLGKLATVLQPADLGKLIAALVIVGLIWVAVIAGTQLLTRPRGLGPLKRATGAVAVVLCSTLIAVPMALAARYAFDTQKLVTTVFAEENEVQATSRPTIDAEEPDPWKDHPRLNILLIGSDGNAARQENLPSAYNLDSIRTDTIMVASINTTTGDTTIIQIPRNLQRAPFPEGSEMAELYPRGFRGEGDPAIYYINELWSKAKNPDYPEIGKIFEGSTYPGAELLKQGVEGITGLKIDYFTLLNIDGLKQLIDAMGGVTVNINQPLPKGRAESCGDWNKENCLWPGPNQHLGGYDAMWYARSRKGENNSDYSRMARQSCLVNAIIKQANPSTMLTSYEAIASASADMVVTDIPREVVEPIVQLSVKVKDAQVERLVFAPGRNGYSFNNPDFEVMREAVTDAIAPASTPSATPGTTTPGTAPATTAPTVTPSKTPTKEPTPTATPSSPEIVDGTQGVTDACAYNPGAVEEDE